MLGRDRFCLSSMIGIDARCWLFKPETSVYSQPEELVCEHQRVAMCAVLVHMA